MRSDEAGTQSSVSAGLGVKRYDQLAAIARVPAQPGPGVRAGGGPAWPQDLAVPDGAEPRALAWWKAADPAWRPAEAALAAAGDARTR